VHRVLLGAVLLILACGGVATLPTPSHSSPARTAAVAPTATIDVSDMMGAFPAATFFVVTDEGVKAIALSNHATKYTIPTSGPWGAVQVAVGDGQVYVADETAGATRLRWIDPASGTVVATQTVPGRRLFLTGIGRGSLIVEPTTRRLLALFTAENDRRVVEAYEPYDLRPLGRRLEASCGDRLLAAADRVVLACFAQGVLVIKDNAGEPRTVSAGIGALVAAAISGDGTTLVGRDDGTLSRIPLASTTSEKIEPFRPARLVADGIASSDPQTFDRARDVGLGSCGERESFGTEISVLPAQGHAIRRPSRSGSVRLLVCRKRGTAHRSLPRLHRDDGDIQWDDPGATRWRRSVAASASPRGAG